MGNRLNVWLVSPLSWNQQEGFGLDGPRSDRLKEMLGFRPVLILVWQLSGDWAGGEDTGEKGTSGRSV